MTLPLSPSSTCLSTSTQVGDSVLAARCALWILRHVLWALSTGFLASCADPVSCSEHVASAGRAVPPVPWLLEQAVWPREPDVAWSSTRLMVVADVNHVASDQI